MCKSFYRQVLITPTEEMVDIDSDYLREIVSNRGENLPELSNSIGYSELYLTTAIYDGRMPIVVLEFLAEYLDFDYDKAVIKKKKKHK